MLENSIKPTSHKSPDLAYWSRDLRGQTRRLKQLAAIFTPWLLETNHTLMESLGIRPQVDLRQLTLDQGIKTLEEVVSSLRENLNRTDLPEQDKKSVEMLLRKLCARLEHARRATEVRSVKASQREKLAICAHSEYGTMP